MMRSKSLGLIVLLFCMASLSAEGFAQEAAPEEAGGAADTPQEGGEAAVGDAAAGDAQTDARYEELTAQAAAAYREGNYADAVALFEQAYAINRVANLLYNMGRAEEKAGDFEAAIAYYERFVNEPGVRLEARQDALARLKTLREVVELRAQEARAQQEDAQASSAQPAPVETTPAPPPAARTQPNYTPAWITLGVAGAAYITSGVFAWQARDAHSDFEAATSRSALRDAASRGEVASIVADSSLALGLILTGVGAYFLISPVQQEVRSQPGAMQLTPQIGPDGAALQWAVSF